MDDLEEWRVHLTLGAQALKKLLDFAVSSRQHLSPRMAHKINILLNSVLEHRLALRSHVRTCGSQAGGPTPGPDTLRVKQQTSHQARRTIIVARSTIIEVKLI